MAPHRYALVVTEDPVAADIFKDVDFLDKEGLFEVGAIRTVKKKSWSACQGTIIKLGTETSLKNEKVKEDGTLLTDNEDAPTVMNRFQELLKIKKMSDQSARDKYLREIGAKIARSGPSDKINPVTGRSMLRLPKHRSPESLAPLREALRNLKCFTKCKGDVQLSIDHDVYLKGSVLLMQQCDHPSSPTLLLGGILNKLVPPEVTRMKGLSRTGAGGTVQLPPAIVEAANVAVITFCRQTKVKIDFKEYNVATTVKNFLHNRANPKVPKESPSYSNSLPSSPSNSGQHSHIEPLTDEEDVELQDVNHNVIDLDSSFNLRPFGAPVKQVDFGNNTDGSFLQPQSQFHAL